MKKFKKIKVRPLTELDSLNLEKVTKTHYDVSELPLDVQKELWETLKNVMSKSDGGIIGLPIQGVQYASNIIKTSKTKGKTFSFAEPNPIHSYYKIAVGHLEKAADAEQVLYQIQNNPEQEYDAFCNFFEEITQGVVFLLMTIEGFINQMPAEGQVYNIQGKDLTKTEIEWMTLTDKLRWVIPVLTGTDIIVSNRLIYDRLHLVNDLRNDLIHLKKIELANFTFYQNLFKRLFDFRASKIANAVFDFIEIVRPGFFVEE